MVVAASGRPPKGLVDGGHDLEREHGMRELESERNKAKTKRCRYLQMRWVVAELQETSETRFKAREGEFAGGSGDWDGEQRKGGGRASDSGFIGVQARRMEGKWSARARWGAFHA